MDKKQKNFILAIETSCDETAAAVLNMADDKIQALSSVVKSQMKLHSKWGGVVPEAAARAHVKNILPVTQKALEDAKCQLADIDYIAATQGPGLIPSLIVGVEFAKALSLASGKPIIPVNHMAGHLYSPLGSMQADIFPMISLIVSGGHTILVLMKNIKEYKVLGQTVDDAAGEAFDKIAKLLKLPYPGGPQVSKLAQDGSPKAINFPRPMLSTKNYNFSFAGLKTAVLYYLRDHPKFNKADVCASFQHAVVDVLITKTLRAAEEFSAKSISLSGGVAANKLLRDTLNFKSKILNLKFFVPPINLCTDNAEVIGLAAAFMLQNGFKPKSYKSLKADSNLHL